MLAEESGVEGVNWGSLKRNSLIKPAISAPEVRKVHQPLSARDYQAGIASPFRVGPLAHTSSIRVDMGDLVKVRKYGGTTFVVIMGSEIFP